MDEQERRAAENQALLARVNEKLEDLNEAFGLFTPYGTWICECASLGCLQQIEMTLAEHEALRAQPARFAVAPGDEHVVPEVEDVVERNERFWVVEKRGAAREVAVQGLDALG